MAFIFVPEMLSGIISAAAGVVSALTSIASLIVSIIALQQQGHLSSQDHSELNSLLYEVQTLQYEVDPHNPADHHQMRIQEIMEKVQDHHEKYGHHLQNSSGARNAKSSRAAKTSRDAGSARYQRHQRNGYSKTDTHRYRGATPSWEVQAPLAEQQCKAEHEEFERWDARTGYSDTAMHLYQAYQIN